MTGVKATALSVALTESYILIKAHAAELERLLLLVRARIILKFVINDILSLYILYLNFESSLMATD